MGLALIIAAAWLVDGGLFWAGGSLPFAGVSVGLAVLPVVLTKYLRRLGGAEAARVYLAEQQAKGIAPEDARHRVHELAPDGVTFDTDDVPSWPVNVILLLGLGALIALVIAIVGLVG